MRSWKFWLGVIVSVVFLAWALQGLNWQDFGATLATANYWWLIPGVLVYFIAVWLRTWRWHYMLGHIKPISIARLFPTVVIGYMGNNVYPARAGEVLRSYVLRRQEGVPITSSLTTVILERLFDGLVMLLFIAITLPFAPLPAIYRQVVLGFTVAFSIALLFFFALAMRPEQLSQLYAYIVDRWLPAPVRPRIHGLFDGVIDGLQSLRSPRNVAFIAITSVLIWVTETGTYWFVMHAFPFEVSFLVLMLMTAVVNLFTTIPSTPGYVGTFHAPGIAILTQFGVPQALATGYTVVLHMALWLPITLLGGVYMLHESLGWRDMEQAASTKAALSAADTATLDPSPVAPADPVSEPLPPEDRRDDITTGVHL